MNKSKHQVEQALKRIAAAREKEAHYTYEYMANELNITTPAYRKVETGQTQLTLERLYQIAEILQKPVSDLLGIESKAFNQINNENATGYQQKIETFYQQESRNVYEKLLQTYEKLLQSKDEQISLLKSRLDGTSE